MSDEPMELVKRLMKQVALSNPDAELHLAAANEIERLLNWQGEARGGFVQLVNRAEAAERALEKVTKERDELLGVVRQALKDLPDKGYGAEATLEWTLHRIEGHRSDCAVYNEPAWNAGDCSCGVAAALEGEG